MENIKKTLKKIKDSKKELEKLRERKFMERPESNNLLKSTDPFLN